MELSLSRFKSDNDSTIGILFKDNNAFECFTLEDEHRDVKVKAETRIPSGRYQVKFREVLSGKTTAYRNRYPFFTWHLELQDVPNFKYVYIHVGNNDDDTEGCILLGESCDASSMTIGHSRDAFTKFYKMIKDELIHGREVWINVLDKDQR